MGEPGAVGVGARRTMECCSARPSRPTTPVTMPAREAATCGVAVFTIDLARCGTCTDSSGVEKAAETADAGPLTGSRLLPGAGTPTV